MSISSILNIAKNSLTVNQVAVQVTSHNISNVNTEGYSRQVAILEEEAPSLIGSCLLGNGVKASGVKRYYDKYLDQQISKKNMELGEQQVYQKYFERIESVLNEDSTKLTNNITEFFNAWQELSTDPQNVAVREGIVSSGRNMNRSIKNIYNELKSIQIEQNDNIRMEVTEINRIVASIADLNDKIFEGSAGSSEANDYLDKRNQYVKELSSKIDITSFEDQYGRMTVLTSAGKTLVDGGMSWELDTTNDGATGFYKIAWKDSSGNLADITDYISGGSLRGLIEMRDGQLNDFIADIDELARVIITEVNSIHENGYTLNHTATVPDAPDGISFFKEITENYAKNIDFSDEVKADLKNIAASSETDSGAPIGNNIALDIAALMDENLFNAGTETIVNYTSSITNDIGQLTKGAKDFAQYSEDTMQAMEKQRESVAGVSLDEEMANLMKYQYAFQASSRLFSVADELFQSILEAVK
ncbi:MAG: flagellar hook-associated protein FlgK [Proteobacteria bacterium]|nr:flagellar hook-associated protein FlgK [Pseudomonadota bacterium]